ncbi:MAG: GlcNAc-PI de-N-acetylase [Chloroflexi bacterium RBG_16_50_9]|nr:MAG: GlcNAc-PI de-N-acetylase [Chloroflexi bacterium RBG_16_50_9]
MKKVLVIAAHPDDEVLGCGGTIARHAQQGDEVDCLMLGEGITSRRSRREDVNTKELQQLKSDARQAARVLGIKKVFFKDFPDNRFDSVPLLDIVKAIEEVKGKGRPEIIYTHHHGDLNIDHEITFKAVLTACRPLPGETVKEIYSFEVPSSTEWHAGSAQNYFMPDVFVDVAATFPKKTEALKAYRTESREYPHPRSPRALEIIARRWGVAVGRELVEAFKLVRWVK